MTLLALLEQYPAELESDFQRVYGVDLLDLYRGELSVRKASVLAATLPAGSAVWRAEGGPLAWTDEAHLLSANEYNTHVAWWLKTKDGSTGKKPPMPHQPPESKSQVAVKEARATAALERRRAREASREQDTT